MPSKLEQLKAMTSVVADTGDIQSISAYRPEDATTNPSLILKAAQMPEYRHLLEDSCKQASGDQDLAVLCDQVAVRFGCEILKLVPGVVSTEVDARLSFDTEATIERARRIIERYQQAGIDKGRVLIKIASTWEGINAARQLEREGTRCNLTLLFSLAQAAAAADAGTYLISPFVGRIHDWYKQRGGDWQSASDDPGVISVRNIYRYYKSTGYDTVVMGASFRNAAQIEALAGCDKLTISPTLLAELDSNTGELAQSLNPSDTDADASAQHQSENDFRLALNDDAMATEKLAEGIRLFINDQIALEKLLGDIAREQAA